MIPKHLRELAARLRPMRDNVIWVREQYENKAGLIVNLKTNRGTVLAVGPGRRRRRIVKVPIAAGEFHHAELGAETGKVRPMTVKPGDFLEFSQYGQTEFEVDGVTLVLSGEQSVLGYADENDTEGVMFPAPAGFSNENRKVVATY